MPTTNDHLIDLFAHIRKAEGLGLRLHKQIGESLVRTDVDHLFMLEVVRVQLASINQILAFSHHAADQLLKMFQAPPVVVVDTSNPEGKA